MFLVASADVQSFEAMLDSEAVVRDLAGDPPRRQLVLAEDSAVAAGWRGEAQFVEGQDVRRIEVQAGVR